MLPAIRSAASWIPAVNGAALAIAFSETLDTGSVPAASAFTVTVGTATRGLATNNGVTVSGATVTLTLASAVVGADAVKVRYTKPATNPLQDAASNAVATFGDKEVTNNTSNSTPTVPSAPTGLTATAGDTQVALAWTSGGDGGSLITSWQVHQGTTGTATAPTTGWTAISGSGASTTSHTVTGLTNRTPLFFRVRAVNGEGSGAASGEASAIPMAAGAAPAISVVRIVSRETHDSDGDGAFDTYARGDNILVDVEFSEAVEIGGDKNVRLRLDVGDDDLTLGNSRKTLSDYSVLRGGKRLRFAYAVKAADVDTDGVWVQTNASNAVLFTPGTATVTAAEGGAAADLTKSGLPTVGGSIGGGESARVDGGVTSVAGPLPLSATVDGAALTVTFDKELNASMDTGELAFYLDVAGAGQIGGRNGIFQQHPGAISVDGAVLTLTLNAPAIAGETVTLSYRLARAGGLLKGADDRLAPAFRDLAASNNTAGVVGPVPWRALAAGTTLKLTFDGALDEASRPAGSAFRVDATDRGDDHRAIPGTGAASVSGQVVTVTLAEAVRGDEDISVSYATPASAALQDTLGNPVAAFDSFAVETAVDLVPPALSDQTAVSPGNQAKAILYFDEALDAGSVPAAGDFQVTRALPTQLALTVASVSVAGNAVILSLTGANALVVGNAIEVHWTPGTNTIRDVAGNAWGGAPAGGIRTAITVGTAAKPMLDEAAVDGGRLTLTYDRFLDPSVVALPGAFTFHHTLLQGQSPADRAPYGNAVVDVAVAGAEAVLLLEHPVFPCSAALTVSSTAAPFRSVLLQAADAIAHRAVTNARAGLCAQAGVSGESGSSQQDGPLRSMELRFDRPLDTARALERGAFSLAGPSAPAVEGAAYSGNGAGVVLTLGRALARGEAVTVAYRRPARAPGLWDTAGNQIADFSGVAVAVEAPAPAVTGVEVAPDAGPDGVWTEGETVEASVTFSSAVRVDGSGGTPSLALIADGMVRRAAWVSGSGTARLTFAYRAVESDGDLSEVRVAAGGLKLNGGAIAGLGGRPAALGFGAAPGVTGVAIAEAADGRWEAGDRVAVTLRFAEPVTAAGAPSVGLVLGGAERRAAYARGSGEEALVFAYTLVEADGGHRGVAVTENSLALGGGSLLSAGGGLAAALAHPGAVRTLEPPPVVPALSVEDAQAPEGGTLAFAVRLDAASGAAVTVDYATADGTAAAGADYAAASGTLTFAPGETAKTVEVAALADGAAEGEETFTLALANAQGATLAGGAATGTVADVAPGTGPALTAAFIGMPAEHDGKGPVQLRAALQRGFPGAASLQAAARRGVRGDQRAGAGREARRAGAEPALDDFGAAGFAGGRDGDAAGGDGLRVARRGVHGGRPHALEHGERDGARAALLSVADARAREGVDEAVAFAVRLSRAAVGTVTVDYATADGRRRRARTTAWTRARCSSGRKTARSRSSGSSSSPRRPPGGGERGGVEVDPEEAEQLMVVEGGGSPRVRCGRAAPRAAGTMPRPVRHRGRRPRSGRPG